MRPWFAAEFEWASRRGSSRSGARARRRAAIRQRAQVQHIRAGRAGDIGTVVDREQGTVPTGRLGEYLARGQLVARLEGAEPLLTDRPLVAQLDDVDSAGQGRVGELGQVATLAARVGTQIQPRRRETGDGAVHTATLAR